MTSFEIGKKSNGFERRSLQVLRLIDDDQYFASSTRLLKEHSVQLLVQGDFVTPGNCQIELGSDMTDQVMRLALGLKNECRTRRFAILGQQVKKQRGLSRAGVAQQNTETEIRFNGGND